MSPAVAMQTGQNSIAPENSLPQLGQVRWDSLFMLLIALQPQPEPKATPRPHRVVRIRPAQRLAYRCPVARVFTCRVTLARHIALRNKIPAARVLRRPVLITSFGDGAVRN